MIKMIEGADILLKECGYLRSGEVVVIVCDPTTRPVGELLFFRAKEITAKARLLETAPLRMHGEEPSSEVAEAMATADLCLGVTAKSMAHTKARQILSSSGGRYLSLPDYSLPLLADSALRVRFKEKKPLVRKMADIFTEGSSIHVTSKKGTEMTMDIHGRVGNCCPGFVDGPGQLGSPPDIEANISPIETSAEGMVVVDGSIPYPTLGLLVAPVMLKVRSGRIVQIEGDKEICSKLNRLFESAGSDKAYVLAECGIGLNDRAQLNGTMLMDEGTFGTLHFGFGSNSTVGGCNDVSFHLDFVLQQPSLSVDGREILQEGSL